MDHIDELRLLTDDERSHFRKWEMFFESEGWEMLEKELAAEVESAPSEGFASVRSWEELVAMRARYHTVQQLLAYPQLIELRKQNLMLQRADELDGQANAPHERNV